ncbi:hypothetical protein [Streptomyces barkulensis]|uniref:hypothetical protein n=1 Tax=Streptomyces barkulensis TaxID=1257026 RepID=UPI000C6D9DB3|nr:hypothetical protein [Streptomyces barkulensis]
MVAPFYGARPPPGPPERLGPGPREEIVEAGPGWYRLRAHARDTALKDVREDPVENHLLLRRPAGRPSRLPLA